MKPRPSDFVKWGALLCGGLLLLFCSAYFDRDPVHLQSKESRTEAGGPVFNRIRWESKGSQDIWLMQQSHHGAGMDPDKRDRLAIVVDKSTSPKTARFYQLEPGAFEWTPQAKPVAFRAACFTCHTNGPRAIRPDGRSSEAPLSFWQWGKVAAWNLRIKIYGRVIAHPDNEALPPPAAKSASKAIVPFRYPGLFENQTLKVKNCVTCHNEKPWGRGYLTRQNAATIRFMIDNGIMPPKGFSLTQKEHLEITAFLQ